MTLRLGELCAGYNGLGMAVEEVFGATPAWFSEYDAAPSKILAHHYPNVPNYGDMTAIDWAAIEHADIISGGTPCQDLSNAGKMRGMTEGTRSNLWVQMRQAITIQKPTYVSLTPRQDPSAATLGNPASIADAYRLGYQRGWEARGRWPGPENSSEPPTDWGKYDAAIRRWERVTGRPAPRPTDPSGRDGRHRLSPKLTEWMMGLPDGWVTDPAIGITRNEQIKACGNGVVPQQATAALRDMLTAFENQELAA